MSAILSGYWGQRPSTRERVQYILNIFFCLINLTLMLLGPCHHHWRFAPQGATAPQPAASPLIVVVPPTPPPLAAIVPRVAPRAPIALLDVPRRTRNISISTFYKIKIYSKF